MNGFFLKFNDFNCLENLEAFTQARFEANNPRNFVTRLSIFYYVIYFENIFVSWVSIN